MTREEQHLDLLAIFHYVLGGITALYACFPLIHIMMGVLFIGVGLAESEIVPVIFGGIFTVVAVFAVLAGWTLAALTIIAGRRLKQRRSYIFCMVVAALMCLNIPLGTILGVFTIVTLNSEPARKFFAANSAAPGGRDGQV